MTSISISRLHFPVTTLGPGSRIGIWLQGCSIRCPGCISADTWAFGRGMTTIGQVISAVQQWLPYADGVTISGGEPFDQPVALKALLSEIRGVSKADVLVYSGYPRETIGDHLADMSGMIDALISEPYLVDEQQTLALRGSDNQRLSLLTELGRERFQHFERLAEPDDLKFDLMVDQEGQIWMAGIPRRDDFNRLTAILSAQHHKLTTTQDRSYRRAKREANDQTLSKLRD